MITDDDSSGNSGADCVTANGGGVLTFETELGATGPYIIEFTPDNDEIMAAGVSVDNFTVDTVQEVLEQFDTQIDSLQREIATNTQNLATKQNAITGTVGQTVIFDNSGNLVASDPIAAARAQGTVLGADNWTDNGDGRYTQTLPVFGVTSNIEQVVIVDVALTGIDLAADAAILEAWRGPMDGSGPASQNCVQHNGYLTFYAIIPPSVNIPLNIGVC